MQCTKCFQWHNSRICTRAQRCYICGLNNYGEENYSTHCAIAHACPARCFYCRGPYLANNINCPIRCTYRGLKTKYKWELILKKSKAFWVRACILAGCKKPQDTNIEKVTTSNRANLPEPSPTSTPTLFSHFRNSNNCFAALLTAPFNRLPLADHLRAAHSKS